mmetsp:Transcript_66478/g.107887  ORF Transcript_66478/g.107887 Transcript_66478/m.107887 type:complete len:110 (+) Transcript_66478:168-497(+)
MSYIYVCVCAFAPRVCVLSIRACTEEVSMYAPQTYVQTTCTMHTHTYTRTHTHTLSHTHVYIHTYTQTRIHIQSIHVMVYPLYAIIVTHIHTYTHTLIHMSQYTTFMPS